MHSALFATTTVPLDDLRHIKLVVPVVLLALFWCWETWRPYFGQREGRFRHGARNLALALFNTAILGLAFGYVTAALAGWTDQNQYGFLHALGLNGVNRLVSGFVLLD